MAGPFTGGGGTFDGGGASGDWEPATTLPMANARTKVIEASEAAYAVHGPEIPFMSYVAGGPEIQDEGDIDLDASASQVNEAAGVTAKESQHKVTLKEVGTKGVVEGDTATNLVVVFEVLPEIVETHAAEYEALAPAQSPGAFQKYKGTSTTQWQMTAMFISRTSEEATRNMYDLQTLRGWMKPFFGKKTGESYSKKIGAPPPVLMLSGLRTLIGPVPVVITNLTVTWPRDVDYIATLEKGPDGNYIPFPAVVSVPIQLVESYSVEQFNKFSLADYRVGRLYEAFNEVDLSDSSARVVVTQKAGK